MRKHVLFYLSLLILSLSSYSCSFSGKLSKRYKTISVINNTDTIKNRISVNAYIIEKAKSKPTPSKTIYELSPKAQAALIRELSKKDTSIVSLLEALKKPLSYKSKNNSKIIDYSKFEKRIIVSIRNNSHMPADRIAKINVTLDIGSDVKILSCNKLSTEYKTIDLAKLNYSSTQSAEINGNASIAKGSESTTTKEDTANKTISNLGYGITGKLSANRSFTEEVLLKQRMVALNAAINKNKLSLYQDGISGIDLTGNIIADVTLGVENLKVEKIYSFSGLVKKNIVSAPKEIKVNSKLLIFPNLVNDISAKISFDADYREVYKKHKTITESDDKIIVYHGEVTNDYEEIIIPVTEMVPKLWKLTFTDIPSKMPVQIKDPSISNPGDLIFNSFDEARNFALWLKSKYNNKIRNISVSKLNFIIFMPQGFTDIRKIQVLPYQ